MILPTTLKNEARDESYAYFNENIRPLPKDENGKIDPTQSGFHNNDVDAFRHAYVSGVFTIEYSETAADILGRIQEDYNPADVYSNSNNPSSRNMDLWNNAIGRKYGTKTKDRKFLLKLLHTALKNGELIVTPQDSRKYEGATHDSSNKAKPLIVLVEDKKGRNQIFYDTIRKKVFTTEQLVALIKEGIYPTYTVKVIHGIPTPVSNPDYRDTNNLG